MKLTRAQLAAVFGVHPSTIDGWVRRGCPVSEPAKGVGRGNGAKFWTPDVVKWRDDHVVRGATGSEDEEDGAETSKALRQRLLLAQTETAELELAQRRAELMTTEEYAEALSSAYGRVGAQLKSLPPKLAAAAVGVDTLHEGLARMEPLVHELLDELARADDVPPIEGASDAAA